MARAESVAAQLKRTHELVRELETQKMQLDGELAQKRAALAVRSNGQLAHGRTSAVVRNWCSEPLAVARVALAAAGVRVAIAAVEGSRACETVRVRFEGGRGCVSAHVIFTRAGAGAYTCTLRAGADADALRAFDPLSCRGADAWAGLAAAADMPPVLCSLPRFTELLVAIAAPLVTAARFRAMAGPVMDAYGVGAAAVYYGHDGRMPVMFPCAWAVDDNDNFDCCYE